MKNMFIHIAFCVCAFASSLQAAIPTDTNVTLLKVKKVTIEDNDTVIIVVAEKATTLITLLNGDQDPYYRGETRDGERVTTSQVLSNEATFTIKQDRYTKPGGALENVWKSSLARARKLQEGDNTETVGIYFYSPDVVIKRHQIASVSGSGYLALKR